MTKLTLYNLRLDLADATQICQKFLKKCHHGDVDKIEVEMKILSNMLLSSLTLYFTGAIRGSLSKFRFRFSDVHSAGFLIALPPNQ